MNDSELQLTCLCGEILTNDNSRYGTCNNCLNDELDAIWENDDSDDHESELASEDYPQETPMFEDYYGGE